MNGIKGGTLVNTAAVILMNGDQVILVNGVKGHPCERCYKSPLGMVPRIILVNVAHDSCVHDLVLCFLLFIHSGL